MATWLLDMGCRVTGYALEPETDPSYFKLTGLIDRMPSLIGDLRDRDKICQVFEANRPEIVFHMAAQSIVRRSYREPAETFAANVMGTVHILEAVRRTPSVKAVVIVTSDKCYENREWVWGYREDEPMGGFDPYSASKGCAELATTAYRRSFFDSAESSVAIATVRAGNVIGGGDWAEDRLIPDVVRALQRDKPMTVRNAGAIRPWQHVLEPLTGYLLLAERLFRDGKKWAGAWNFGPRDEDAVTVDYLVDRIFRLWGKGIWETAPTKDAPHEAHYLKLDCSKARQILGWKPCLTLDAALELTVEWYRAALSKKTEKELYEMTCKQIRSHETIIENLRRISR